jgi:hypothetical protein
MTAHARAYPLDIARLTANAIGVVLGLVLDTLRAWLTTLIDLWHDLERHHA